MKLNKNIKTWKKAKRLIAGGTMLVSKNPEFLLPKLWPTYFSKAKGIKIWDLNKKVYKDFSSMSVGTNILGYANQEVDDYVVESLRRSNMSTLNCPEEVNLAEKILSINPWAQKVRFTRSGGEANACAIRLARAHTGKSKILFCGYHGWHDWYLAANLKSKNNLNNHLMNGLKVNGVPKELGNTSVSFLYNDIDQFKKIIKLNKDIGIVKMEVVRDIPPNKNFLETIRKITREKNIVLIFDECTSGFRETNSGIYKKYGITPDMCIFGKALGNGYAINAIVGKNKIMNSINNSFISSTFWTEKIGYAAGIKTLEIMQKEKSWKKISRLGLYVKTEWNKLFVKYGFKCSISGISALPKFNFTSKDNLKYRTFITQEFLKKKILATNQMYMSILHDKKQLEEYFYHLEKILESLEKINDTGKIDKYLETRIISQNFQRLN